MRPARSSAAWIAALVAAAGLAHPGDARASAIKGRGDSILGLAARADMEFARFFPVTTRTRHFPAAKPAPGASRTAVPATGARGGRPLVTATGVAVGQAGYVHYFIIEAPDGTLEIQVGIELPDQRIAWSFPGTGVAISPFIEAGVVQAGGKDYEVWHLYGIRPFPDDAAMAALAGALMGRIEPWIRTGMPYCENDGPKSGCMSCLGFVLRALFPGRTSDYPDLPRDFWRAGSATNYTTRDLLLYLTGMLDLPTREARLLRIARQTLPDGLREDLEELVQAMGAFESAGTAAAGPSRNAAQKPPGTRAQQAGARAGLRKKL